MATSSHLSRKLRETLGPEAAEDLVTWMQEIDTHRGEISELRREMHAGFARLESKFGEQLSEAKADLIKWSFVFWVGAVLSIAALARVLRP